ncbi:MAG: Omp28-related outer membrane protein [Bacteroidia bacterium]|nr:Omp28-related outer membrane protein [Bacteroidia bacterium]
MKNSAKSANTFIVMLLAFTLVAFSPAKSQTIPLKPCLEHFTASSCPPCGAWAPVFRDILSGYEGQYTIIRYQMYWPGTGDPYYFAESKKRRDYYMITGVPGLTYNGVQQVPYAQYFSTQKMDSLLTQLTGVQIGITSSVNLNKIVTATVTITPEIAYAAGLITHIVVMEGITTQNATTNGEKAFDHVTMGFMPNANGTVLPALVPGQPVTLTYTIDMKTTHIETANDLLVAAFIQDNSNKKVIQSNNAPVSHPFLDYQVALNVIDNDYNTVPGGKVFIPYYGEQEFGINGLATFKGVLPGVIRYNVTAPGYDGTSGELTVAGTSVSEDVMLEKPDLFYYEDFGWNEIPAGWDTEVTNGFYLYGSGSTAGSIVLYKPNAGVDESYLIMPPINLNQSGIFSFKAGVSSGSPELRVGIATLEMKPGTKGTEGLTITGFAELYSVTVSNTEDFSLFGFQLTETIGNKRLAFKFVGPTGSWCELDQVAVLEDNPGVKVQFLVTDQNDVPLKSTAVTLSGITVVNNAYGYASFRDNTSGIAETASESRISIFPNPVADQFMIRGLQTGTLTIMTLNGQGLLRKQIRNGEWISTQGLTEGLYLLKIQSENRTVYRKIMVSR